MFQKISILKVSLIVFGSVGIALLLASNSFAASGGVEDLLVDFTDYLSSRIIPATGALGVITGGALMSVGNEMGGTIVKYSILGSVIGVGGAKTISTLFF